MSIFDLMVAGGWLMIVLGLLSLIAIYIFIERLLAIHSAEKHDPLFMDRIRDYLKNGELKSAVNFCRVTDTPGARLIERGISRIGRPAPEIQAAIENTGNLEVANLEKRLNVLATISGAAPMIGFLGTVIGMVQVFFDVSQQSGVFDISTMSGGIYQAMVTTVAGLIVGIVSMFAYNYLVSKVDGVVNELERKSLSFMDIMNEEEGQKKINALSQPFVVPQPTESPLWPAGEQPTQTPHQPS